jgi:hypothetical protein
MKYLDSAPMFFAASTPKVKAMDIERGGLPAFIEFEDRCPSGRHNKRLTDCICGLFEEKKPKRNGRV